MADFNLYGTPWQHQTAAFEKGRPQNHFALFMDPGTGKTYTAILLMRAKMLAEGRRLRTLILAPPVVLKNWRDELLAHSKLRQDDITILHGAGKKRAAAMDAPGGVVVTNYESLNMKDVYTALIKWMPEVIIADESHRIKEISSKRTKAAIRLARLCKYRYILTGTPVLNSPKDLFSQFLFLDGGAALGDNYRVFMATYFFDANAARSFARYPIWRPRKGAIEKCGALIANKSFYAKKSDCLDLPPLTRKIIEAPLSPAQRRAYDEIAEDLVTYIDGAACVARIALTKALRLQQCVSGFLSMEGENGSERSLHKFEDCPRLDALRELLTDLTPSSKVLVWCVFKENYRDVRDVCNGLGVKFVEVHGDVSATEKHAAVDALNTDEDVRVLIGHPGSGGIGVNLVAADTMIFLSRGFSLEYDIQAEARNYRGGSERHAKITRYDIVAPGTIDALILDRLAQKQDMGEDFVQQIKKDLRHAHDRRDRRDDHRDAHAGRKRDSSQEAGV